VSGSIPINVSKTAGMDDNSWIIVLSQLVSPILVSDAGGLSCTKNVSKPHHKIIYF
jgi:hypothetical protein